MKMEKPKKPPAQALRIFQKIEERWQQLPSCTPMQQQNIAIEVLCQEVGDIKAALGLEVRINPEETQPSETRFNLLATIQFSNMIQKMHASGRFAGWHSEAMTSRGPASKLAGLVDLVLEFQELLRKESHS